MARSTNSLIVPRAWAVETLKTKIAQSQAAELAGAIHNAKRIVEMRTTELKMAQQALTRLEKKGLGPDANAWMTRRYEAFIAALSTETCTNVDLNTIDGLASCLT